MVSHAELSEAQAAHDLFALVNDPKALYRDGRAVREARGEAGARGLVPRRQPRAAAEQADFVLAHADFDERASHAAL